MTNWILARASGWELFIPFVATQAVLLAYVRMRSRPAWAVWIFIGTWTATVTVFLVWSPILKFRNNAPVFAGWLFIIGVATLCPFICAQIASALLRRHRSHLAYGALVFAAGIFLGVPLLAVTSATVGPLVSNLMNRHDDRTLHTTR
ncbi:MAG: hypothetical protein V4550_08440 [Gemmatimonadota bacterium]